MADLKKELLAVLTVNKVFLKNFASIFSAQLILTRKSRFNFGLNNIMWMVNHSP